MPGPPTTGRPAPPPRPARPSDDPFPARLERFGLVDSTNDIVREWLAGGTPQVCVAVADEQAAGRGRHGRSWSAPSGRGLLLSLGFRPSALPPERTWRLAAVVSLAMADAAEEVAGLRDRTIRLKWPNDLVAEPRSGTAGTSASAMRKLGGVLGESDGLGTGDPRVIIGIGVNVDWRASEFPPALAPAMTSLSEVSGGRPVDREALLDAFLARLEPRLLALDADRFDVGGWHERQATTGRRIRLEYAGEPPADVLAVGVDGASGALLVADPSGRAEREVLAGEVTRVRIDGEV